MSVLFAALVAHALALQGGNVPIPKNAAITFHWSQSPGGPGAGGGRYEDQVLNSTILNAPDVLPESQPSYTWQGQGGATLELIQGIGRGTIAAPGMVGPATLFLNTPTGNMQFELTSAIASPFSLTFTALESPIGRAWGAGLVVTVTSP